MQTLIQYAELASLILTVAGGLLALGARAWLYLDHGKPSVRADWVLKAVRLAAQARQDGDQLLGTGPGSSIEDATLKDLATHAQQWLGAHGLTAHLDAEAVRLVLTELRSLTPPKA